ncbi:hypothetical protein [Psychromonas sp. Urea-02u-13]|uniref:hypothetical protein n=1 Tax=Psychromonas sp. Urea-02u-13 TaxID=2058326 RepID=UPI001E473461|nr:hypothetical protein [Psychromonas sp. Urea-02u-13]
MILLCASYGGPTFLVFFGVVKLLDRNEGTIVKWDSSFESANSEEVTEFCDPIYQGLLSARQQTLSS